jgi:aryl-alcohol dehydrogenase-like predicted oxidoreductase
MRLTGPGTWYHGDERAAKRLLRRAFELGVTHFDTADAYGPESAEHYLRKALHRYADGYPEGMVIATKGGMTRQGPNQWRPVGRPEYLRQCVEMSLRRLAVGCVDLYYLHRIDPLIPLEEQVGALAEAQAEGKIRHIGLSKVTTEQIDRARTVAPIAAVQNKFNLNHGDRSVTDYCAAHDIAFVACAPLAAGEVFNNEPGSVPPTARVALRYLLELGPHVLAIPGTMNLVHLEENCGAAAPTGADSM